jgi:capsular exopolysaccharide synthesis family protein
MDRLEKALEKARKLREENLRETKHLRADHQAGAASAFPSSNVAGVITSEVLDVDESQLEQHRILAHHTRNAQADIFRILRTQVLQIMNKSNFRTLAITSPNYGDGKTTIALNLAVSITLDLKQTVLLADLDLRKPNLHEFLGLSPTSGLSDYLINDTPIPKCLMRLSFERLSMLPAGRALDNSSEVLGSPKMAALARELKTRYSDRMVIYDMPPILCQDDSIAFLPHVDAVLMVFRDGVTSKLEVKQCLDALAGANVIGTVLNNSGTQVDRQWYKKLKNTFYKVDSITRDKFLRLQKK